MSAWDLIPWALSIGVSLIILTVPVLIFGAGIKLIKSF